MDGLAFLELAKNIFYIIRAIICTLVLCLYIVCFSNLNRSKITKQICETQLSWPSKGRRVLGQKAIFFPKSNVKIEYLMSDISTAMLNPHKVVATQAGVRLSFKTDIRALEVTGWRLKACVFMSSSRLIGWAESVKDCREEDAWVGGGVRGVSSPLSVCLVSLLDEISGSPFIMRQLSRCCSHCRLSSFSLLVLPLSLSPSPSLCFGPPSWSSEPEPRHRTE